MATIPGRDIVVVAASAGGLEPLRTVLGGLPADLPASVHIVLHMSATGGRALPHILDRAGPLSAESARDGEPLRHGRVYVAPPDRHMLIDDGRTRLSHGPRQNGLRPAADPLFRSAALFGGPRTTAVVLSGSLDDAALGSATVERQGGAVLVQDPAEASYVGMPKAALATTQDAIVVRARHLATAISRLATQPVDVNQAEPPLDLRSEVAGLLSGGPRTNPDTHAYSGLTCPDCGGPLYQAGEEHVSSFNCLVGHRWSPQSLYEEQGANVERALWLAVRSLEERVRLTQELSEAALRRGHMISAARFAAAAEEAATSADAIRKVVIEIAVTDPEPVVGE
ncbi:MAG: chemotaxis protein CheB [Streptosporangiaceae bacterium]|nr:chemotaxis protein CheB [Streptosporangiaceae bacterium]